MSGKISNKIQKHKITAIAVICLVITPCLLCRASVNKADELQTDSHIKVYLPREVTIKDSNLKLGQISFINGSESLAVKANGIAMGRISIPGQKIVIDRTMVLSRLACNGIPASKVILTGSEKITVKQQNHTVSSSRQCNH